MANVIASVHARKLACLFWISLASATFLLGQSQFCLPAFTIDSSQSERITGDFLVLFHIRSRYGSERRERLPAF